MQFKNQASPPRNAIAVIFDLEGFSRFFNQPDVQVYVGAFINRVFTAVAATMYGGPNFFDSKKPYTPLEVAVAQAKFMGDGVLYILTPKEGRDRIPESDIVALSNRLWNTKIHFKKLLDQCADDVPVVDLPPRIRFGLARGTIYELEALQGGIKEYIGFALNLASRLQRYCPNLGFIASARLGLPQATLEKNGYVKVIATGIRGFPKEVVIVDKGEFLRLEEKVRDSLFQTIPTPGTVARPTAPG